VLAALLVIGVVFRGSLTDDLFSGKGLLWAAWLLALAGACASHLVRGTLSGQGRFGAYARCVGGEAVVRFALGCALAAGGVASVGPYGLAVAVGPFVAIGLALRGERELLVPGPPAPSSEVTRALVSLLLGSVLSMALVNAGPVAVELLGTKADEDEAGRFLAGLVIARIPLFMFQAVQAALLPTLAALVSEGRTADFRRGLGRLLAGLTAVAAVGCLAASVVGPFTVRALFGEDFDLANRTMGLLAVGSGAFMVAMAIAQANIALGGHTRMALAWGAAVIALLVTLGVSSHDLFLRVELATVAGGVTALAAQAVALVGLLRGGASIEEGDLIEAITDISFEP
jgi:O-antigen/teichoic acid export membrane protein